MGADVNKPDIFVQIDYMANANHSHAISAAAIKTVVDAFATAPYISRSGSIGINLHVDAGPNSIMNFATGQTWGPLSRARQLGEVPQLGTATVDGSGNILTYNWKEFDEIKDQPGGFTSSGRTKIFRYCISAHQLATASNSGIARAMPGSDFIISLGTFTGVTDTNMAGTFMHELGHCLGLDHGGGDNINNKPNYVSVMNYLWQFSGVTRNGTANIIDYSNAALGSLNEAGGLDDVLCVIPSLRQSLATSPRSPFSTIQIFFSAERCRRVALRMSRTVFSALSGMRLLDRLIVAPCQVNDEPEILPSSTHPICLMSADGGQRASSVFRPGGSRMNASYPRIRAAT